MRPAIIAAIAVMLPLGAYAHPGHWGEVKAEKTEAVSASATKADEGAARSTTKSEKDVATNDRIAPTPKTPLCASPAVSIWNEAATGKGIICKPTMWAGLDSRKG